MGQIPSPTDIEAGKTSRGGWARSQLAKWGIPWPPPHGWKHKLELEWWKAQANAKEGNMLFKYSDRRGKKGVNLGQGKVELVHQEDIPLVEDVRLEFKAITDLGFEVTFMMNGKELDALQALVRRRS